VSFRCSLITKILCAMSLVLLTAVLRFFRQEPGWGYIVLTASLLLLFIWGTLLCFMTRITISPEGIRFEAAHLLPTWELRWHQIGHIKIDSSGTHDTPSIDAYVLIPNDRRIRKRIFIGPWIANYKQLLREVLEHVPPDATVDPAVVRIVRKPGETSIQQTAQAIVARQRSHYPS